MLKALHNNIDLLLVEILVDMCGILDYVLPHVTSTIFVAWTGCVMFYLELLLY